MAANLEFLMHTGTIGKKGKSVEQLGQALNKVMGEYSTTTEELIKNGLEGVVSNKLDKAHTNITPGMTKHSNRIDAVGTAISQAAKNTKSMADNVARNLKIQGTE